MALNRRKARTKEERKLFPFWTLLVIAGCAALWVFGAKIYQERMAAYRSYAAITQTAVQDTYYSGVTVDGIDLGGMTREEAASLFPAVSRRLPALFRSSCNPETGNGALHPTKCR